MGKYQIRPRYADWEEARSALVLATKAMPDVKRGILMRLYYICRYFLPAALDMVLYYNKVDAVQKRDANHR